MRGGNLGHDLVDGETLADDAGAHDDAAGGVVAWCGGLEAFVCFEAHAEGVLDTAFARDGVGAARIDDYGSDAVPASLPQHVPAHCYGGGLELVCGEDGGGGAWGVGCDEGEVIEAGV